MALEFIVVAFALVFPGAFALRIWDFVGRIESRSPESLYGMGALLGLVPYSLLHLGGAIHFGNLLTNGTLRIDSILTTPNMFLFLAVTAMLGGLASCASRWAHGPTGQAAADRLLGRTLGGSNWAESTHAAMGEWVNLKTATGHEWMGVLDLAPDTGVGYVKLRCPEYFDGEAWLGGNEAVILPIAGIQYLLVLRKGEIDADRQDGEQNRGPLGQSTLQVEQGDGCGISAAATSTGVNPRHLDTRQVRDPCAKAANPEQVAPEEVVPERVPVSWTVPAAERDCDEWPLEIRDPASGPSID